jgi:hypothetical protein
VLCARFLARAGRASYVVHGSWSFCRKGCDQVARSRYTRGRAAPSTAQDRSYGENGSVRQRTVRWSTRRDVVGRVATGGSRGGEVSDVRVS